MTTALNWVQYPIITIDGPSGAGKGTVAWNLAQALGYQLLDSGALYRIVGLQSHRLGLLQSDRPDEDAIAAMIDQLAIAFHPNTASGQVDILINGDSLVQSIRNETVGNYASQVAVLPKVRQALLQLQQDMASRSGVIADGRDMGTVVFPQAAAKVYLTASAEARAKRRMSQLIQAGKKADYADILATIKQRDQRDETRTIAPSKPAVDALVVDSSALNVDQVFAKIKHHCQRKGFCF